MTFIGFCWSERFQGSKVGAEAEDEEERNEEEAEEEDAACVLLPSEKNFFSERHFSRVDEMSP